MQPVLECTSQKRIGAAAVKVGLKRNIDDATIVPGVRLLDYRRLTILPVASFREVFIFHHSNGDAIYAICEGVVGKTLDAVLTVCTDVGPSTARAAVRAWAQRAESAIGKSSKALPVLTVGRLMFVACQNSLFPKSSDKTTAFEMNVIVQHSGLTADRHYCTDI